MRNKLNKKALSPVIAELLLIGIAVTAGVLVYAWSMGGVGTMTGGTGQQSSRFERLVLDAYDWPKSSNNITLYFKNVGSSVVVLDAIYVSGKPVKTNAGLVLSVQTQGVITVTPVGFTLTSGSSYTLKCVTKTGGVFTFSIIYDSHG